MAIYHACALIRVFLEINDDLNKQVIRSRNLGICQLSLSKILANMLFHRFTALRTCVC